MSNEIDNHLGPRITALMTTFNAEKWVNETIASILKQTISDFEFLIIDDGSSDNTVEQIKSFSDRRIRLVEHKDNKGVGTRLDEALDLISTPYIAKVDADDISEPQRFEKQLTFLEENSLAVVKCLISYFPDNENIKASARFQHFKSEKQPLLNKVTEPEQIAENLSRWMCVLHTTYFACTSAIKNARYPHVRIFEDYILFLRLKNAGFKIGCVNECLVNMRVSDNSTTMTLGPSQLEKGLSGIISEKWPNFENQYRNKKVYIYGTGNLAKTCLLCLKERQIEIASFVEREPNVNTVSPEAEEKKVISLEQYVATNEPKLLILAAQPVRNEIALELERNGLKEIKDFLVLA